MKKILYLISGFILLFFAWILFFHFKYEKLKVDSKIRKEISTFNIQEAIKNEIKNQVIQEQKTKMKQTIQLKNTDDIFSNENFCTVQRASYLGNNNIKFWNEKVLKIDKSYYPKELAIFLQKYCIGLFPNKLNFKHKWKEYKYFITYKEHIPYVKEKKLTNLIKKIGL